jgi:hypothetical protein
MSNENAVADVAMEELGDVVIRALKKAARRLQSQGLEKDLATKVAVAHVLGCCSGALCVAFNREPPPDAKVINLIKDTEAVLMKYTQPKTSNL